MVNQATKHGSEAIRPMSNSAVPVLFSLKNVQPLILGVAPSKEKGQSADAAKPASSAGLSTDKIAAAGIAPTASFEAPITSRPTKVQPSSPLFRTVGTVLLILLFILVIRMSVPNGSRDAKLATGSSANDSSSNTKLATEKWETAPVAKLVSPMSSLPELEISVPSLPLLASTSEAAQSPGALVSAPKEMGLELGKQNETNLQLESPGLESSDLGSGGLELGAFPKSNSTSPMPTLLAAAPSSPSMATAQPAPPSDARNSPYVPLLNVRETNSSEMMPYSNAPELEMAPYGAARPEIRSTNSVRETSTPNLDNMDELFSLYRKGKEEGLSAQSVQASANAQSNVPANFPSNVSGNFAGSVPARQVSASNPVPLAQPQSPYVPLSASTNWPTNSLSPASLNGQPSQGMNALPAGSSVNNSMPMSGQSYPPPQRVYEPLTVPAYEQPMANSSTNPNNVNRYQSSMIRQPVSPTSAPIAQPRMPYSPVGPTATGAPGASYGYPPINVPSN